MRRRQKFLGVKRVQSLAIVLAVTTSLCSVSGAHANPVGGTVTGGNAAISSSGNTLTVQQNSDRALIDWNGFDISQGEATAFRQPSSASIAVNRVHSTSQSQINGALSANGNIVIINPNGVLFGKNASVNVNSITATSSNIDDNRFMAGGKLAFTKPGNAAAQVINNGTISVADAGLVGLVAPHVENNGIINARLGKVTLASGDTFTLDLAGDGLTQIAVSGNTVHQLVANAGTINADGGTITLTAATARNTLDALVTNTGTLQANTFQQKDGAIYLAVAGDTGMAGTISNSGAIAATGYGSGNHGGKITLTADTVVNTGVIDVSGDKAGDVAIQFHSLYSDSHNSLITANSVSDTGGSILLMGDDTASITATGSYTANGLNGGMINFAAGNIVALNQALLSAEGVENGGSITLGGITGSGLRTTQISIDSGARILAEGENATGGTINIIVDTLMQNGQLAASGVNGGAINVDAAAVDQAGTLLAEGVSGTGGNVNISFSGSYTSQAGSLISVKSMAGSGGNIDVEGGDNASLYASGTYISNGSTTGGFIDLLASQDVFLFGASLSGQGGTGGGTIRVGGDFQGASRTRRAQRTYIDKETVITVDAVDNGDGGKVAVWSDEYTQFYGTISARGGLNGGNGGYVETSGRAGLAADGIVIASATHGVNGEWLLDPADITITTTDSNNTGNPNFVPSAASSTIAASTIVADLNAGTNVTITTGGDAFAGNGDITVSSAITSTGAGSLTLSAYRNITVSAGITLAGGNLTLRARNANGTTGYVDVNSTLSTSGGSITIGGGSGTISAGSGYAIGSSISGTQYGVVLGGNVSAGGGNIIINGQGGTYGGGSNFGVYQKAAITTSGTGTISVNGVGGAASGGNYGILNGIAQTSSYGGTYYTYAGVNITSTGSGAISLTGVAGNITGYGINIGGNVGDGGGNIYTGAISINAGAGLYGNSGTIQTKNNTIDFTGTAIIASYPNIKDTGSAISYSTTGSAQIGNIVDSGAAITLTASGSLAVTSVSDSNGAISLSSTGALNTGALTTTNAALTLTSSGSSVITGNISDTTSGSSPISIHSANVINVGSVTGSSVLIDARSTNAATGSITTSAITTGGGNITLGGGSGTISAGSGYAIGGMYGVEIVGNVDAGGGNIVINGQGGNYINGGNYGVYMPSLGGSTNHVTTSGTGTINISGIGGTVGNNNYGIYNGYLLNSSYLYTNITSTGSGAISLTGSGGSGTGNIGLNLGFSTIGGAGASGNINLTANTLNLTVGGNIRTTGNINVFNSTPSNGISVGANVVNTLNVNDTAVSNMIWGGNLNFGDTNTGNITINSAITYSKPVYFFTSTGADISLAGNLASSSAGNALVLVSGRSFLNSGNKTITTNNGRWIIYSATSTGSDQAGGITPQQTIYRNTYTTLAPSAIVPSAWNGAQNTWVYGNTLGTITITALNASRYYGVSNPAFSYGFSCSTGCTQLQTISSGLPSLTTIATAGSGVGTYTITAAQGTLAFVNNGYIVNYANGTLTVNPALLTITAADKTMTYGRGNPAFTYNITNGSLVNSDSISSVSLNTNATTSGAGSYNVGSWNITPSNATGTGLGNYSISYANGTLTVNPALLTITAADKTMTYGRGNPAFTYNITNGSLVNSDSISSVSLNTNATTSGAGSYNVGSWNITPSNATGTGLGNYSISYAPGTMTVNKAFLTVVATAKSKIYDNNAATDPALSYTYSGLVNGDSLANFTGALSRAAGEAAGTYAVSQGALAVTGNYVIGLYHGANFIINPVYTIQYTNGQFTIDNNATSSSATVNAASLPVASPAASTAVAPQGKLLPDVMISAFCDTTNGTISNCGIGASY